MGRIPRNALVLAAAGALAGGASPAFGSLVFREPVAYTAGAGATGVAVADVDGDGRHDVVVSAGALWVLRGDGAGRLGPATGYGGGTVSQPVVAEVNGDARPDLVAVQRGRRGSV